MPETLIADDATQPLTDVAGAVELVGQSSATARLKELVRRAAVTEGGVLLTGEAGVAIDGIAENLHARSRNAAGAFVIVECDAAEPAQVDHLLFGSAGAEPESDLESVAADSRIAASCGGTLYLRHVSELPAAVQARLARVARDGEVRIDGVPVATAWRLVASAPPTIDADVRAHRFRGDLFRRLSAIRIDVPSLRERPDDVPAIAVRLLADLCASRGVPPMTFTQPALSLIGSIPWPGNAAEIRAALDRIVDAGADSVIPIEQVLPALQLHRAAAPFVPAPSLREARLRFEREYIAAVLQHHHWRMADAAQTLGIQRPNLYRKARQLGIPLTRVSE